MTDDEITYESITALLAPLCDLATTNAAFVEHVRRSEAESPTLRTYAQWRNGVRQELDMRLLLKIDDGDDGNDARWRVLHAEITQQYLDASKRVKELEAAGNPKNVELCPFCSRRVIPV